MRVYDKEKRLHHSLSTIDYFMNNEFMYYSKNNIREFEFEGKKYKSLYKRLNVQLLVTKKCPFNCTFCIEKINPVGVEEKDEEKCLMKLKNLLLTLKENGMEPTVSITGGEPVLFVDYIERVIDMLNQIDVKYNINTSGVINKNIENLLKKVDRINLSVHHYDIQKNAKVFGAIRNDYWNHIAFDKATIQTVMVKPSYSYLLRFLNSFKQKRFSIRMLCDTKEMNSKEWYEMLEKLNKDNDFQFIQQKIGDYYWFEEYKYKDKTIRFSYASLKQLEYYKNNLEDKQSPFVRAVVITPSGNVEFDWIQ